MWGIKRQILKAVFLRFLFTPNSSTASMHNAMLLNKNFWKWPLSFLVEWIFSRALPKNVGLYCVGGLCGGSRLDQRKMGHPRTPHLQNPEFRSCRRFYVILYFNIDYSEKMIEKWNQWWLKMCSGTRTWKVLMCLWVQENLGMIFIPEWKVQLPGIMLYNVYFRW